MTTMTDGNTDFSAKLSGTGGGSENAMAALFLDGITKFSGDDKTVSSTKWAQDLEDNAEIFQWSPQLRLIFARRSLVGTAALWLKGERAYKTYEELKAAVQKEFPESVNIKEMHEIMAARKKRRDESYYQYMLVMKELARRAKFPDYVGVQYVIDGIPDYESNKSLLYGATTYPALKEKLILYEKTKSKSHHTKHETISKSSGKIKDDETRRRQPSIRCYNCGDVTHVAKECVNGVKCFGCNKFNTGHLSSRCPDRINPAVAVTSSSVKQFANDSSSGGGGSAPFGRSVKPQSHFGNMADCHDDTYENDNTCQNCQNDSTRSMSVTNSSADVGVIQMQVQNKTKSGKPMKEVTVKQTTMKALIDSGSDVNLLSVEHGGDRPVLSFCMESSAIY